MKDKTHISLKNNIEIRNLCFRYGNRDLVLNDINISIKSGETIAIVGESGSGKTTLAKLIMAFFEPESGEIIIGNNNIFKIPPSIVRSYIGYISQDVFLFSNSIKNNLVLGNSNITMSEIENACRLSRADEFINKLPMKYDTLIGENGCGLSGGQRQRLAIARALLKKPKILIMDEATSNLDFITEKIIKDTIDKVSKDITCIIIAHRLSTIKNCDTIYVMDNGRIVEYGNHNELISKKGIYKKFYDKNTN